MSEENSKWDLVIEPRSGWFDLKLRELWKYRDLTALFIKRDFVTFYKQTVLGPVWYVLQPLFTTLVFTIVFGRIAQIPTDGVPPFLFYLAGNVMWLYFSENVKKASETFILNSQIFGKVYFPRMTVPISIVISNLVQFTIQFALFVGIYFYFYAQGSELRPNIWLLALPLLILQMAAFGLGVGIIISALTTKYRDLRFALTFGIQLWMYASPVVYPASQVPAKYLDLYMLNPMAPIIECFRFMFIGAATVSVEQIATGAVITVLVLFGGVLLFNRVEKTFMDTV